MSRFHGNKMSGLLQTVVLQIWQKKIEYIDIHDYPLHDCNQEQSDSPNFSSIVRQCQWPSRSRKIVDIQKFGYRGNVTSHFSSL